MFLSSLLASSSLPSLRPIKSQKPYGPRDDDLKVPRGGAPALLAIEIEGSCILVGP